MSQLMTLYHRLGRLADVLQVYRQCHGALTRQLGVRSSAHTQALLKDLTGGES
jgi:DNA-binding SARP family transcriptional activator